MKYILGICIVILFQNCSQKVKMIPKEEKLHVSYLPGDILSSLKTVVLNDDLYMAIHNEDSSSIRIFKVQAPDSCKQVIIPEDTSFGEFRSFLVHNADSVFIKYERCLLILNRNNAVISKFIFNDVRIAYGHEIIVNDFDMYAPVLFRKDTKSVIFRQYPYDINYFELSFYQFPVFTEFSLKDGSFTDLNIYYPKMYDVNSYGGANRVHYSLSGGKLLMSFQASPLLYVYDLEKGSLDEYSTENTAENTPFDLKNKHDMSLVFEHLTANNLSLTIFEDPVNHLYYRLVWSKKEVMSEDGTFNSIGDKDLVIETFDEKYNYRATHSLGNFYDWDDVFVWNGSIYVGNRKSSLQSHEYSKITFLRSSD